jgi:hypothetical protein
MRPEYLEIPSEMQLMYHGEEFALSLVIVIFCKNKARCGKRRRLSFWQILVSDPPDCVRAGTVHAARRKLSRIKMKTKIRKKITSRIKIRIRTRCPRLTNAGSIMNAWN